MLVILMKDHLLQPSAVCQSCPMASQSGLPRWQKGRLRCGRLIEIPAETRATNRCPAQYECAMGFRVAELADTLK